MLTILNAQNKAGNTTLHWAALNGHLEAVKILLEEGADPTITNLRGHDAVYEAEINDKREVVEWVLREGGEGLEIGVTGEEQGEGDEGGVSDEDEGLVEGTGKENSLSENCIVIEEGSTTLEKQLGDLDV